jgi:hypothetical protein
MVDDAGKPILGALPFTPLQTGYIKDAAEKMQAMMNLYALMTRALGISDTSEGADPKPRTSAAGIQLAAAAGSNSTYFLEKYYVNILTQCGDRIMHYLTDIVDEKDTARLKEFQDVVGQANGMAWESIKDIPKHKLGLYVEQVMDDAMRQRIDAVANQMAGAGLLDPDIALFIASMDNVKQAMAILRLKSKQKSRELQAQAQQAQQAQAALSQQNNEFEMAKIQAMWQLQQQMRLALKQADGQLIQMENQIKQQGQLDVKDRIGENRIQEKVVDKQLREGEVV